jgi:hypothetical protein
LYYIIGALVIFCGYLYYVNYHKNVSSKYEFQIYKDRIDSLNTDNMRLNNQVLYRDKLDSIRLKKLDSLTVDNKRLFESREKLKKQIIIYDTFKSVDINASADSMHSILTEAGFR